MSFSEKVTQLNNLIKTNLFKKKYKESEIFFGEKIAISVELCSHLAPLGKVLVLSSSKTFESFGKDLLDKLIAQGNKPISIIEKEDFVLSVDNVCGTFSAPEDVRAVIVLDYYLFDTAKYFSAIRNIPLIQVVIEFIPKRVLAKTLLVKNGEDIDVFFADVKNYIVVDEDCFSGETVRANTFATIVSKIVALTDYRVMGTVMRQPLNVNAYNIARQAVLDTFKCVGENQISDADILYNAFLLEIADALTDGKLLSFSAPSLTDLIYNGYFAGDGGVELLCASSVLDCYKALFSGFDSKTSIPTAYIDRAKSLSDACGFLEENVLLTFKMQGNRFAMRKAKINQLKGTLCEETKKLAKFSNKIVDKYIALGGKTDYDINKLWLSISLSGDTPLSINTMSLVREEGIIK